MRSWMLIAALAIAGCGETEKAGSGGTSGELRPAGDACEAVIRFRASATTGEQISGLAKQGAQAVPILLYVVTGDDTQSAIAAAEELVKLGAKAIPALTSLLRSNAPHRGWAAWALGEMGPAAREATPALEEARNDPEIRTAAMEALNKIGH